MCGIYKITNKINGKAYIGLSQNIEERWKDHRSYPKTSNKALYRAFNKYGLENFTFEVIEECSQSELSSREIYWIDYYKTFVYGYNETQGGEGYSTIDQQKVIEVYRNSTSCKEAAEKLGISPHAVGRILTINGIPHKYSRKNKAVIQLTKDGEYIREFETQYAAAKFLIENHEAFGSISTVAAHIGQVCRGIFATSYGFRWKYNIPSQSNW